MVWGRRPARSCSTQQRGCAERLHHAKDCMQKFPGVSPATWKPKNNGMPSWACCGRSGYSVTCRWLTSSPCRQARRRGLGLAKAACAPATPSSLACKHAHAVHSAAHWPDHAPGCLLPAPAALVLLLGVLRLLAVVQVLKEDHNARDVICPRLLLHGRWGELGGDRGWCRDHRRSPRAAPCQASKLHPTRCKQ